MAPRNIKKTAKATKKSTKKKSGRKSGKGIFSSTVRLGKKLLKKKTTKEVGGEGVVNSMINKLPFEMHLPGGYQYCGPGTKLDKRLKRNDPGINELDRACKEHDIAYSNSNDIDERNRADKILAEKAWKRVKSKDSGVGEKMAALGVTGIMKTKSKLGMGLKPYVVGCSKNKKKKNWKCQFQKY